MAIQALDDRVMDAEFSGDNVRALKSLFQLFETAQQANGVASFEPAKVALIAQVGGGYERIQLASSPGSRIR